MIVKLTKLTDDGVRKAVCQRYKELTGEDLSPFAVDMTLAEPMIEAQIDLIKEANKNIEWRE